jgi:hypothetical protein
MGQVKKWMSEEEFEDNDGADPSKWWRTSNDRLIHIESMDLEHLENVVNYFSQDGYKVDPMRQSAFENVMLTYLRKKAEMDEMIERTQHDIL